MRLGRSGPRVSNLGVITDYGAASVKDRYSLLLASDVLTRDGLGLELYDESGARIAEVFREDTTGERTLTVFVTRAIHIHVVEWLLSRGREEL